MRKINATHSGHLTNEILEFWGYDKTDKKIDLRNRNIKSIDKMTFHDFENLIDLNLSDNHLKSLDEGLFDSCKNLKSLGKINIFF